MRCSHPERRLSTFIFTTLLFTLSFIATLAESANVHGFRARHAWRKRAPLDVMPTEQVTTPTPEGLLPSTILPLATGFSPIPPTSLPSISVPFFLPPSTLTPPSLSSLQMSDPTSTSSSSDFSTPSPTEITTTSTTSQAQVQTTSQGTPLSLSSSQLSSQHSSSALSTSGAATVGAATPTAQKSATPGYSGPVTSNIIASYSTGTTISATPSSESSSNSGFFSNTGAVAGTFTVAGLFGVAGIVGVGMMIAKRRLSRSYEDDMEYLEKKLEPAVELSQSQNFVVGDIEESLDMSHVSNSMEVTVPPAAHLYPQQDVYLAHGPITNGSDGYENQGYYPQGGYPPQVYGIAYPSRESYAAADPYGGIDESFRMQNPFDDVATELPATSRPPSQQLRTSSPPLTAYLHRSIDSFYGSSAGASHGHAM